MMSRAHPLAMACVILTAAAAPRLTGLAEDAPPVASQAVVRVDAWMLERDPFWPVGYTPPKEPDPIETKRDHIRQRIEWPRLALKGLTHTTGGRYLAIIDGIGVAEAGDVVSVERARLTYRWRIDEITRRGIRATRLDVREVNPPLQTDPE